MAIIPASKTARAFIIPLILVTAGCMYVAWVNRQSEHMTGRQKILRAVYPAFMAVTRLFGKGRIAENSDHVPPQTSFYSLKTTTLSGDTLSFEQFRGKKVLIVNTASDCGYTAQYAGLQDLYIQQQSKLVVIGFPSSDFKDQEKEGNAAIAQFCKKNYGITFPLSAKSHVVPGDAQHAVFAWLTHKNQNGWNNRPPSWNFSKYLINEQGVLMNYFDPSVPPLGDDMLRALSAGGDASRLPAGQ